MYGIINIVVILLLDKTWALIEDCNVNSTLCADRLPPKLGVDYSRGIVVCDEVLLAIDVTLVPTITFNGGTEVFFNLWIRFLVKI